MSGRPDVNNPSEWKRYRANLCEGCWAGCCTMPVEIRAEDLIRLGLTDEIELADDTRAVAKRLIKEGVLKQYREATGLFMLSYRSNGDCHYLEPKSRLCGAYDRRPEVCRKFPTQMSPRIGFCPAGKKQN